MGEYGHTEMPRSAKEGETKGGGLRGGPKRWTGRGPAPARHIPWPEVGANSGWKLYAEDLGPDRLLSRSSNITYRSSRAI